MLIIWIHHSLERGKQFVFWELELIDIIRIMKIVNFGMLSHATCLVDAESKASWGDGWVDWGNPVIEMSQRQRIMLHGKWRVTLGK